MIPAAGFSVNDRNRRVRTARAQRQAIRRDDLASACGLPAGERSSRKNESAS